MFLGAGREVKKAGPFAELLAKMERSRSIIQKNSGKVSNKFKSKFN